MQFSEINKMACQQLRKEMQELLNKYGENHGLEFHVGNMSFTDSDVKIKVEAKVEGALDRKVKQAREYAAMHGFSHTCPAGEIVEYNRCLRANGIPMPWVVKKADGKRYKMTRQQVIDLGFGSAK